MSIFENMTEQEIRTAQKKLDKLCKQNSVRLFSISAQKAPWKEIVLSMCGLNQQKIPKNRGPKPREQEHIDDFLQSMMCFTDFGSVRSDLPQSTMEDAYKDYLKNQSKRFNKPFKSTKSLENVFSKRYKDFIERRQKAFEDSGICDPDLI